MKHPRNTVSWQALSEAIAVNPNKNVQLGGGAATASLLSLPSDTDLSWLPGWSQDTNQIMDVISASLWIREPLYRTATSSVKRTMEMEEASFLMNQIESAYKSITGHTWVRKHLEEELRFRSGGGAAQLDFWSSVRTTKRMAQLVDFVCRVREFRLCVFYPDKKEVTNIPLKSHGCDTVTLVDADSSRILLGSTISLNDVIIKSEMAWFVPLSEPGIGSTTMARIIEELKPGIYKGNRMTLWKLLQQKKSLE